MSASSSRGCRLLMKLVHVVYRSGIGYKELFLINLESSHHFDNALNSQLGIASFWRRCLMRCHVAERFHAKSKWGDHWPCFIYIRQGFFFSANAGLGFGNIFCMCWLLHGCHCTMSFKHMPILHVRVAMSAGLKIRDCKTCEETTLLHIICFLICGSVGIIPDSRVQLQTKHNEDDSCIFAFILCTHNPYGFCCLHIQIL